MVMNLMIDRKDQKKLQNKQVQLVVSTYLKHSSQNGFILPPSFGGTLLKPNGLKPSPRFRTKSLRSYHSLNLNSFGAFLLGGCVHSRFPVTFHLSIGGNSQAPVVACSAPLTAHKNFQLLAGRQKNLGRRIR